MASIVLGSVGAVFGSFIGGPMGASMGWAIGSAIGSMFQKGADGPRLKNLQLQGSEYGKMIPIVYGGVRVPGQVIWQTQLEEHKEEGGKGGPSVTTYSYSASFAVLICEGPIDRIQRIWADGTLIYDTTGDNPGLPSIPVTIYRGTATQLPDPTMEAVLGVGNTPAHRGFCYVVFTDWYLTNYGNRLPSLNFEVSTTPQAELLSIVKSNYATGAWAVTTNTLPILVNWPASGNIVTGGPTVSSTLDTELINGAAFDPSTFAYVGPATSAESPYNRFPTGEGSAGLRGVGMYQYTDHQQALYWSQIYGNSTIGAASVITDDSGYNFLTDAGVPGSLYLVACCLSQDGVTFWAFTSFVAANGYPATHYYKIVEGVVVADGPVNPPYSLKAYGVAEAVSQSNGLMSAENDGVHFWYLATDQQTVSIFEIDDLGTFAEWGGGTLTIPWPSNATLDPPPNPTFPPRATLKCLAQEGYAGAFYGDSMVLLSRFVPGIAGIPLSEIIGDLSSRAGLAGSQYNVTALTPIVDGAIIDSQSACRDNVNPFQSVYQFDGVERAGVMTFVMRDGVPLFTIPNNLLATQASGGEGPPLVTIKRAQELDLPSQVSIRYINAANDYQVSTQYARRVVTNSQSSVSASFQIVMTDEKAAAVAATILYNAWTERVGTTIELPRKYWRNEPTDVVIANGYLMRLIRKGDEVGGVVKFEGLVTSSNVWIQGPTPAPGEGFTPITPPIFQLSNMALLDIPLVVDTDFSNGFYIAVSPTVATPWPSASIFKSSDALGTSYAQIATISTQAIVGTADGVLAPFGGGNVIDASSSVTVTLGPGGSELSSCTYAELLGGANPGLIGNEEFQWMTATEIGAGQYTLTNLLRGRRGTEWAMYGHAAGERFVAFPTYDYDASPGELGQSRLYKAVTAGGTLAGAPPITFTNTGAALRPYSPTAVGGGPVDPFDGVVRINWQRRTRIGGAWVDFADVPLSEPSEKYIVQIWDSTFTLVARIIEVTNAQTVDYTSAQQVTDFGADQLNVYVTVGQVGAYQLGVQTPAIIPGSGASDTAPLAPVPPYNSAPPPPSGGCALPITSSSFNWATPVRLYNAGMDENQVWVIALTTGASQPGIGVVSASEYAAPATSRHMTLSATPCGTPLGPYGQSTGNTVTVNFYMEGNPNPTMYPTLLPSTTYYINITSVSPSGMSCDLIKPV